ncbi:uncharacterized protein LOC114539800 [Dendronephthya gigantea]|uniref:uncharacterized protein LOC114539800 n=1 Tax=Dendronephthya gigantea TaxID=151771 RepID=UPI001068E187|nr:uncharacterized protein LOC114539800 [Dendronephthya gigantea]
MGEERRPPIQERRVEGGRCSTCIECFQNIRWKMIFENLSILATFASIGLAITAIVLAAGDITKLGENENELDSVREEINECWNNTYERIQSLSRKIDEIDASLNDLIAQTKSTLENKITNVKSSLTSWIIGVQNQVSDMNTNVDKVQTGLESFEDSTNSEFSKLWKKFKEVDNEIANLPQNKGSLKNTSGEKICAIFIIVYCSYMHIFQL